MGKGPGKLSTGWIPHWARPGLLEAAVNTLCSYTGSDEQLSRVSRTFVNVSFSLGPVSCLDSQRKQVTLSLKLAGWGPAG